MLAMLTTGGSLQFLLVRLARRLTLLALLVNIMVNALLVLEEKFHNMEDFHV